MVERIKIRNMRDELDREVPAIIVGGVLAVHRDRVTGIDALESGYTVTHVPTGYNVGSLAMGLTREGAMRAAQHLLSIGVDWEGITDREQARDVPREQRDRIREVIGEEERLYVYV